MRTILALLASVALSHAGELHDAVRTCDANRLHQILSRQPSLGEMDENGLTPLHIAIDSHQTTCVGLLLEAGADRQTRDRTGRSAFDAADKIPNLEERATVRLCLLRKKQAGPMPWTLEPAEARRLANDTSMLIALGTDPNRPGAAGTTPFADAVFKGDLKVVRAFLARGAKLNAVSEAGTQPIHDAALGGFAEVILELVTHGADVNARTRDEGQTPLHAAAVMDKMKAVETLVALGADLSLKDCNGRTPLEAAERAGLTEVAAFLKRATAAQ